MPGPEVPRDLVVIGGGIAGLALARDVARAGRSVLVLEAETEPGGCVRSHTVGGLRLDRGAESFATVRPAARTLVDELGLRVVTPIPAPAWVRHEAGQAPLPRGGLLGIPADPRASDLRAVLGRLGSWRARVDPLLPADWGWRSGGLGGVVRRRLGPRVLRRLVDPVAGGVYSTDPAELDPEVIAPGLRAAALEMGSLSGAVARMRGRSGAGPGAAVAGLLGGMAALTDALVDAIRQAGGEIRCGCPVEGLRPDGESGWTVTADSGTPPIAGRAVAVATPAAVTDVLLRAATGGALGHPDPAGATAVVVVTLVVRSAALDAGPRGTGMLVSSRSRGVSAKALTHATAKWAWLAQAAGPGVHVLRLSYGRGGSAGRAEPRRLDESSLIPTALADASDLLGVGLDADDLIDAAVVRYRDSVPAFRPGQADALARLRAELTGFPGLWVTGAAVAGTGLAAVIADARATATRVLDAAAAG